MDSQSYLPMSKTTLITHNSWQDNTGRLLLKKKLPRKYMKNHRRWISVDTTLQGMLPCNHSVRICGDVVGPKYALMPSVSEKGMPKSSHAIAKLISSVGIRYPPNQMPRMAVQSRGRTAYSPQLRWKVIVLVGNYRTKASPILCLMVYRGILIKLSNPCSLRNLHSAGGS